MFAVQSLVVVRFHSYGTLQKGCWSITAPASVNQPSIGWHCKNTLEDWYIEGAFSSPSDDVRMCNQLEPRGFSLGMQRSIEWYGGSGNTEGAYHLCMKRLTWRGGRWSFPSFRIICSSSKFQVWTTKVIDTRPSNWLQLERCSIRTGNQKAL